MNIWQRWKQTSLPNKLLVVASILMAFGTLFYGGVAIFQYRMMREQSETTKRQLEAMQQQSIIMQKSLESLRDQSNSDVYLTMRNRYFSVWSEFPQHYEDLDVKRDDQYWHLFKRYWYVSFDEWYVTQKIGAFRDLWSGYYEYAYLRSADKKSMRTSLCLMKDHEFENGVGREFVRAIEDIYSRNRNGQILCARQIVGREPR